jgi:hypothetical protein
MYYLRIEKNIGFFKKPAIIGGINLNIKNDKIKIDYFMIYDKIYYDEYPELRDKNFSKNILTGQYVMTTPHSIIFTIIFKLSF